MYFDLLAALHAPFVPILRHVLATLPLPRDGVVLDLACGPGLKTPLLAEACGRGVRLVGLDCDRAAVQAAWQTTTDDRRPTTDDRRPTNDQRPTTTDKETRRQAGDETATQNSKLNTQNFSEQSAICNLQSPRATDNVRARYIVPQRTTDNWIVGDALALPLHGGCCAAVFCIAALGLFADRRAALRELRRALRSQGLALLVVGTQAWAPLIHWRGELAARVEQAYADALTGGALPLPASPDLSSELASLLSEAGFDAPLVRAFLLDITTNDERRTTDRPPTTDHRPPTTDHRRGRNSKLKTQNSKLWITDNGQRTPGGPLAAELPLLPWPVLRPLLAGRLTAAQLAGCDRLAAEAEIELCSLVLTAQALAP